MNPAYIGRRLAIYIKDLSKIVIEYLNGMKFKKCMSNSIDKIDHVLTNTTLTYKHSYFLSTRPTIFYCSKISINLTLTTQDEKLNPSKLNEQFDT